MFRLKKEMIVRVNTVASEFRKVSNKQMAETTKRTLRENVAINAQLSKMSDKTMELIQDNDELKEKETSARLQTEMLEHNETELIKKNASNLRVNSLFIKSSNCLQQSTCLYVQQILTHIYVLHLSTNQIKILMGYSTG